MSTRTLALITTLLLVGGPVFAGKTFPQVRDETGSAWRGEETFKATLKGIGGIKSFGQARVTISADGSFFYSNPDGVGLDGTVAQKGKKLRVTLSDAAIEALEDGLAGIIVDRMRASGVRRPGSVAVTLDRDSLRVKAKLTGNESTGFFIKFRVSAKLVAEGSVLGSQKGKIKLDGRHRQQPLGGPRRR